MAFLTPDRVREIGPGDLRLTINEKIIPDNARAPRQIAAHVPQGGRMKPAAPLGGSGKARGITIHNTSEIAAPAGTTPAEQYARATWPNANMAGVVVHFYVWKRAIWQLLSLTEQGWHASDGSTRRASKRAGQAIGGNLDTIAIEVIGSDSQTQESAAILTAWLMTELSLAPPTDLYTHNYFMGHPERIVAGATKNCPLFLLPRWEAFSAQVQKFYTNLNGAKSTPATAAQGFVRGDRVHFAGGPVFLSSDAKTGQIRTAAECRVTATAPHNPRPYHLESITPGIVFGWADAVNVSLLPPGTSAVTSPADPQAQSQLLAELTTLKAEHDKLGREHAKLRGEITALAKNWPAG
ncbi:MAG: peptidoglycan recognition protein family protein [Oscillospiraceae bacterium]|nr:peptidoglycan recognition protein family protein [Oscillospiraceae bacterium]